SHVLGQRPQIQLLEQVFQPNPAFLAVHDTSLENGQNILLYGQLAENRRLLSQVANPQPGPQVHGKTRDRLFLQGDPATTSPIRPNNVVNAVLLPPPMGTSHTSPSSAPSLDRAAFTPPSTAILFDQILRQEEGLGRFHRRG